MKPLSWQIGLVCEPAISMTCSLHGTVLNQSSICRLPQYQSFCPEIYLRNCRGQNTVPRHHHLQIAFSDHWNHSIPQTYSNQLIAALAQPSPHFLKERHIHWTISLPAVELFHQNWFYSPSPWFEVSVPTEGLSRLYPQTSLPTCPTVRPHQTFNF